MADKNFQKKDEELFYEVGKLIKGNYDSYQNVYELSKKYIYKIINDVVQNHHTTEDLMQETYLQIYRKIDTLMEPKAFYVWAGRIATNLTFRHIQKNKNEDLYSPILENEDETATIFDRVENDTEAFIPETVLENAEQQKIIAGILDGLSAEQKLSVQYYYFEELSVNDIAKAMECSTGTVKSRLNYARKALKEAISTFEVKNGVKLYSMGGLPIFLIVFRNMADSAVLSATTSGAAAAIASGAVIKESVAGCGAVGSGSATALTATSGATVTSGSAAVGIAGKLVAVVTAICVSVGTAVVSTNISTNNMLETRGYVVNREEAVNGVYYTYGILSPTIQEENFENIEELIGETELTYREMALVDEDYLKAIDDLAKAMVKYEKALKYSMTPEQYAYIDEIMSAYYTEMENYLNQGVQYGMIESSEYNGTFERRYMPELIDLIDEETELILESANIYSQEEIKNALYLHTAEELEYVISQGYGAGDLILYDLSEDTAMYLFSVSQEYFSMMQKMIAWSEKVMSDPDYQEYFVTY